MPIQPLAAIHNKPYCYNFSIAADAVGCYWPAWSTGISLWIVNTASICTSWFHLRVATRLNSSAWGHLLVRCRTCYNGIVRSFVRKTFSFGFYSCALVLHDILNALRHSICFIQSCRQTKIFILSRERDYC